MALLVLETPEIPKLTGEYLNFDFYIFDINFTNFQKYQPREIQEQLLNNIRNELEHVKDRILLLNLRYCRVVNKSFIETFKNLTKFGLHEVSLKVINSVLNALKDSSLNLKKLCISLDTEEYLDDYSVDIDNKQVTKFNMPSLVTLNLFNFSLTTAMEIFDFSNIRNLKLEQCIINDLPVSDTIEDLKIISCTEYTKDAIYKISSLKNLKSLKLIFCSTSLVPEFLLILHRLESLRKISISDVKSNDTLIACLLKDDIQEIDFSECRLICNSDAKSIRAISCALCATTAKKLHLNRCTLNTTMINVLKDNSRWIEYISLREILIDDSVNSIVNSVKSIDNNVNNINNSINSIDNNVNSINNSVNSIANSVNNNSVNNNSVNSIANSVNNNSVNNNSVNNNSVNNSSVNNSSVNNNSVNNSSVNNNSVNNNSVNSIANSVNSIANSVNSDAIKSFETLIRYSEFRVCDLRFINENYITSPITHSSIDNIIIDCRPDIIQKFSNLIELGKAIPMKKDIQVRYISIFPTIKSNKGIKINDINPLKKLKYHKYFPVYYIDSHNSMRANLREIIFAEHFHDASKADETTSETNPSDIESEDKLITVIIMYVCIKLPPDRHIIIPPKPDHTTEFTSDYDFTIIIRTHNKSLAEEIRIPCHKSILSSKSEMFRAMFNIQMKESLLNEMTTDNIYYKDFIEYLYTHKISLNKENILPLIELARMHFIKDLEYKILAFIYRHRDQLDIERWILEKYDLII